MPKILWADILIPLCYLKVQVNIILLYLTVFFTEQPLLLYMENSEHKASALFSDATTEELLSESGQLLISEALTRLGVELAKEPDQETHWKRGYLICQEDKMVMELAGLKVSMGL